MVEQIFARRQNKKRATRLSYAKTAGAFAANYSRLFKPGDLVLDPFCGCGTTAVAANELKRKWAGIDISAFPVELIRARLHDIRKQIYVEGLPRDMKGAPSRTKTV